MGLFKSVIKVLNPVTLIKKAAPVLIATSAGLTGTALSVLRPKALSAVGIKSAAAQSLAHKSGIAMSAALAIGGGAAAAKFLSSAPIPGATPATATYDEWLKKLTLKQMGGLNSGTSQLSASDRGPVGIEVPDSSYRQGRRSVRRRRGRCWTSHGRRYCYR